MAHSPYKAKIVEYVAKHPGCSKMDVARHITYSRNPAKSYAPVNTAIANGWIVATKGKGGAYELWIPEAK